MNTNKDVYESLKEKGIIHSRGVDVTFVRDNSYGSDVMLYGHGLELRATSQSVETIISHNDLYELENKNLEELIEWISMEIESLLDDAKIETVGNKASYKKKLYNALSGIKSTFRQIIALGEKQDDHIVNTIQAVQSTPRKQ